MKSIFALLVSFVLFSCNNPNTKKSDNTKVNVKPTEVKCELKLKTFVFKDIQLGGSINDLKYTLQKDKQIENDIASIFSHERFFDTENFHTYKIKDASKLTMFDNNINSIKIHTYKNNIYAIDIFILEDAEKILPLENVLDLFIEKFGIPGCGITQDSEASIFKKGLKINNSILSINANIFNSDKKNKPNLDETSNSYLKMLKFEITNLQQDSLRIKEDNEKQLRQKKDVKSDF
jgi:hypothetical protein